MSVMRAVFTTYEGRKMEVDFAFPYPKYEKTHRYTMEKLADMMAEKTRNDSDPIVNCIKIEVV